MQYRIETVCLLLLSVLMVVAALSLAADLFAPIIAAFTLGIVMTPLSDLWDRLRLPGAVAAFLSVFAAISALLVIAILLEPYVTRAIAQGPVIRAELREAIIDIRSFLRGLEEISEEVAEAIEPGSSNEESESAVSIPSLTDALFYAPRFLAHFLIFTGTLYFFLLARDAIYEWLSQSVEGISKDGLRRAAKQVSVYVITISAINACLGIAVSIAMQLIGMPSPIVWGLLACLLNFVLYLGPALMVAMLTVTGVVVFEGAVSFLPAAIYLVLNGIEAQFMTPVLVGKNLKVNPLLVFLSLVFWLWLWGPIGGVIAIPLLIWTLSIMKSVERHAIASGTPGSG